MTRRFLVALIFGLAGAAVLIGLGIWQMQRLAWKEAILAEISAKIGADPVALPPAPVTETEALRYLPVTVSGRFTGEALRVLVSRKEVGPGVRVIEVLALADGRRVMVDRGFLPDARKDEALTAGEVTVTGNLHWPSEVDGFTPPPDPKAGLWFARDVPAMAAALQAEPVLVVAKSDTGDGIEPMPADTSGIPNDHFGYAIQWFGLAAVWLGMTVYLLWRIRRRTV